MYSINKSQKDVNYNIKIMPLSIVSMILLLGSFCILICFWIMKIDCFINSDDASELVLSSILSQQNRIITKDWFYSTELKVLHLQILYALFFKLTNNWHLVRVYSYISAYLILLAIYRYFCKQLNCKQFFTISATMYCLPFSETYYWIIIKGAHYIPHITIILFTLAIIESFCKSGGKWKLFFAGAISFLAGLGGPRLLIILYFPLVLASAIMLVLQYYRPSLSFHHFVGIIKNEGLQNYFITSFLIGMCSGVGYVINTKVLVHIYHFYSWSSISYISLDVSRLTNIFNGFLYNYGFKNGSVFSMATFSNMICVLWIALTVISIGFAIRNRKSVQGGYYRLAVFVASAFLVMLFLYIFTDLQYEDIHQLQFCLFLYVFCLYQNSK